MFTIIFPSYDNLYLRHDIALVRLNRPLNINRRVQEICLPHDSLMSPGPGSTCIAAGWGDLTEDGPSSEQLRHVQIPVLAQCSYNYNNINYQICGGYAQGGMDACQGDSGGPLYCRDSEGSWYLGGVISHGKGCARAEEAGVYVRLSYYLTWLHDVLSGQHSPGTPGLQCPGLQCDSGECVPDSWVCDLKVDCLDGGDVRGCVTLSNGTRVQLGQTDTDLSEADLATSPGVSPGQAGQEFDWLEVTCSEEEFHCSSLYWDTVDDCYGERTLRLSPDWRRRLPQCFDPQHCPQYGLSDEQTGQVCRALTVFSFNNPDISYLPLLYPVTSLMIQAGLSEEETYSFLSMLVSPASGLNINYFTQTRSGWDVLCFSFKPLAVKYVVRRHIMIIIATTQLY